MDNFSINVVAKGKETLRLALNIVFAMASKKAIGYSLHPNYGIILYWTEHQDMTRLPYALTESNATDFIYNWLMEQDYGEEPDHDGSNSKGWKVFNESWGHVNNSWEAMVAIKPVWAMYGK